MRTFTTCFSYFLPYSRHDSLPRSNSVSLAYSPSLSGYICPLVTICYLIAKLNCFSDVNKFLCRMKSPLQFDGTHSTVGACFFSFFLFFLDASSHLFKRPWPSVGPCVGWSVGPSVTLSSKSVKYGCLGTSKDSRWWTRKKEGRGGRSDEDERTKRRSSVKKWKQFLTNQKGKSINFNPWRRIAQGQK